jgi:L-lactate dehydrogenase complex protein LldG
VTGVYLAIAETGTLLFLSSPDTPAATSLLPETHVAVVPADRIVRTMEEAWARMRAEGREVPRAINFVSGPSRTADIEGQLQIGAHGPFRVHVVIVG